MLDDAVAMLRPVRQRLQDEQFERAGQEVGRCVGQSHQRMMGLCRAAVSTVNSHHRLMDEASAIDASRAPHGCLRSVPASRRRLLAHLRGSGPRRPVRCAALGPTCRAGPARPRAHSPGGSTPWLREHGDGIVRQRVARRGRGRRLVRARSRSTPRATASAIKTFYLVELFDRFAGALDRPLPGVDAVLADDAHPAIAHFTPEQRAEIRRELTGATVRRVGLVMMGIAPASNIVYNAAANVTTAPLGGPEALTAADSDARPPRSPSSRRAATCSATAASAATTKRPALGAGRALPAARRRGAWPASTRATMDAIHAALRRRRRSGARPPLRQGRQPGTRIRMCEVRAGWYDTAQGAAGLRRR